MKKQSFRAFVFISFFILIAVLYVVYEYKDGLAFRYAQAVQLPKYRQERNDPNVLTVESWGGAEVFLSAMRERLAQREFRGYYRVSKKSAQKQSDMILSEGFKVRGNPVWRHELPFDWSADPQNDRNWRFKTNALDQLDPFVASYSNEPVEVLFGVVKAGVFDWINYNLILDNENDFKWYDMSTGIRATKLAFVFYHGVKSGLLTNEEAMILLNSMDLHVQALVNPSLLNHGNHGLFQMLGLASICHVVRELRSCETGSRYAADNFIRIAKNQFTVDGMHSEHSSQYHPWAIKTILGMVEFGYFDELEPSFLDNAKKNAVHYFYPNGDIVLLGDTGTQNVCSIRELHPHVDYYCSNGKSGHPLEANAFPFMDSGYVVVRSDVRHVPVSEQSYFLFNGAYHSQAHKQADDLSVVLYEKGRPVLIDSGKFDYDDSPMREYFVSSRAHNTVEVLGQEFARSKKFAYGSAIRQHREKNGLHFIDAGVKHRFGVNHARVVLYKPSQFLIVVDKMESTTVRTYRQWFHFDPSLRVDVKNNRNAVIYTDDGNHIGAAYFSATSSNTVQVVQGQMKPEIQGWLSREYKKAESAPALSNVVTGNDAVIVAGYDFSEMSDKAGVVLEHSTVRFCNGDGHLVLLELGDMSFHEGTCP